VSGCERGAAGEKSDDDEAGDGDEDLARALHGWLLCSVSAKSLTGGSKWGFGGV
jgi:hypothetical protein